MLPATYPAREYLGIRGLMSYGVSPDDLARQAAGPLDSPRSRRRGGQAACLFDRERKVLAGIGCCAEKPSRAISLARSSDMQQ